jgi:hypothetical protein
MKRLLIVSPHFPPVNAPDMHRIRTALPYFVEAGWEVTVLAVDDPTPTAPLEPELAGILPPAVRVVRARCFSRGWTALFGVNNVALRSLPFLCLAGRRLLRAKRHDVVYFSTTMFITLPLGRIWRMLTGVPYVVDLQDPWVTDYYERPGAPKPPGGWKYGVAQALGRTLEGWTLRGAGGLVAVSTDYLTTVQRRYPRLTGTPAIELPFGSPDPDLAHLRATFDRRPPILRQGGVRLAFAGALGPGQLAAVEILLAGMALARRAGVNVSAHFFGTSYAPNGQPATLALAARHGLADCVHESPQRLRYFESLQVTLEADANLLFGSTDLPFTPSKLVAVIAAGRPVLAVAPVGSAMVARLQSLEASCVTFPIAGPVDAAVREIAAQLGALAAHKLPAPRASGIERYSAAAVARRQMDLLTAVS